MNAVRPILYLVDDEPERFPLLKQASERCGEFSEIRGAMDAHLAYQELCDRGNTSHAVQVLVIMHWQPANLMDAGNGFAYALGAYPGLEDIPVIAISHSPRTDLADALACGCKAFFRRPVGLAGWIALLRKLRGTYCEPPRKVRRIEDAAKRSYSVQNARPVAGLRWILHLSSVWEILVDRVDRGHRLSGSLN